MRTRTVLPLLLPLLAAAAASASTAHMVADLEPGVQPFDRYGATDFQSYTPVNGRAVFLSFDPSDAFQCNLWATDGTAGGTERLAELCGELSDSNEIYRTRILAANGEVAFLADPLKNLWRTDGTVAGTFPLGPIDAPGGIIGPDGRTFFFSGCTPAQGCEPWVSDGTPAGTRLLRALARGSASSNPAAFTVHGRRVLFAATGPRGPGLWATDGTVDRTVQLVRTPLSVDAVLPVGHQIYLGVGAVTGSELWVFQERAGAASKVKAFATDFRFPGLSLRSAGGRVFLVAVEDSGGDDASLWETDGTPRGTRRIGFFTQVDGPYEVGGRVVFEAGPTGAGELWSFDSGARVPRRFRSCPNGCPRLIGPPAVRLGNRLFFLGVDGAHGQELWTSDGTPRGTRLLKDLCPGRCSSHPGHLRVLLDRLLFTTSTGGTWVTDGTTAGTVRLAARPPDESPFGLPLDAAEVDGRVVFTGFDDVNGLQPWVSDLTPAGTKPVEVLGYTLGASSNIATLISFGGRVLFTACGEAGFRAFVSDGTLAGTVPLPLPELSCEPYRFISGRALGDVVLFDWNGELWRTDGTPGGTIALGPSGLRSPRGMAELDGRLLLVLDSATDFGRLWDVWTSDGTPAGTRLAFRQRLAGTPSPLAVAGDEAFFLAQHPDSPFPTMLWRTDGTGEGTRPLLSLRSANLSFPPEVVLLEGRTFLLAEAEDRPFGAELWVTDGTAAGTVPVFPGENGPHDLQALTVFQGGLYFFARLPGSEHTGLWRSDGTAEGTVLLKAIGLPRNPYGVDPPLLTPAGDDLFFRADDDVHGSELWATGGTAEGTRLVRDVAPGRRHSRLGSFTVSGGRLFFTATDGDHGLELWESDGTAEGTRLVQDVFPGPTSSFPSLLTAAEGSLFFTANDGPHGRELWEMPLNP